MTSTFNLWTSVPDLFAGASGALNGETWGNSNGGSGSDPIWSDDYVPSAESSTGAVTYTIVLTTQDWVLTTAPETVVATPRLVNPFGPTGNLSAPMAFSTSSSGLVSGGIAYWNETSGGAYVLDYRTFTTQDRSAPSQSPNTTLGAAKTLFTAAAKPVNWKVDWSANNFLFSYETAGSAADTTDIHFEEFTTAGAAIGKAVQVVSGVSDPAYTIGYDGSTGNYYEYYAEDSGYYAAEFKTTSGALHLTSAKELISFSHVTEVYAVGSHLLSDGSSLRIAEVDVGGDDVLELYKLPANPTAVVSTPIDSIDFGAAGSTGQKWADAGVYDPADKSNDYTAVAYVDDGQVHLELFNASGVEIGSDFVVPGITSFDRLRSMGRRVELDYTYTNGSGSSEVGALIYDTAQSASNYTLSGGGEYVGTPFDDTVTDAKGDYYVDGGGGTDTFVVNAAASAVSFEDGYENDLVVRTSGGAATLNRFTFVKLANEELELSGGALSGGTGFAELSIVNSTNQSVAAGTLELAAPLAASQEVNVGQGSTIELQSGTALGASLAFWTPQDTIKFDKLTYSASDHLAYLALSSGAANGEVVLENSANHQIGVLFKIVSGTYVQSDFEWSKSGAGSTITF